MFFNLPTLLTWARIVAIPLIIGVFYLEGVSAAQQNLIRQAGARGLTEREIDKSSRKFRAVPQRQQVELLNSLQFVGHAMRVEIPPTTGRGKPRHAWIAMSEDADTTGTDDVPA